MAMCTHMHMYMYMCMNTCMHVCPQAPANLLRDCRLLDAGYVAARARQLYRLAERSVATRSAIGYFVSPDALAANRTWATRSTIYFGAPVPCRVGEERDANGGAVACAAGDLVAPVDGSTREVGYTPYYYTAFNVRLKRSLFGYTPYYYTP